MRIVLSLVCWLALLGIATAQNITGNGFFGDAKVAGGGAYTGPGDIFSTSVVGWYSCTRAYSTAYAAAHGNMCDVSDVSGAPVCTMIATTAGGTDLTSLLCAGGTQTVATFCAAQTSAQCIVKKFYDQSGNGSTHDLPMAGTLANAAILVFAQLNGLPVARVPGIQQALYQSTATVTTTQPFSYAGVTKHAASNQDSCVICTPLGTVRMGGASSSAANLSSLSAGTAVTAAATDSAWHAIADLANGASSIIAVDGVDSGSLNAGTNVFSAVQIRALFESGGSIWFQGDIAEFGLWNASNAGQRANLSSNAHTFYAF